LIIFTNDKGKMGRFANRTFTKMVAWVVAAIILVLNLYLLWDTLFH
jgi:manganese transport protein